ncbi:hypothetical protein SAMN06893096_10980 [Geodermatophilus pulveris]|uniref:Uncharacterized protein n=1 Tax=Geodermatophilus pulveris TaxID=1564159 RepID=A0A239HY80_9ACTN|nr:hypothetical protein [Geodermatophilus pulveris]SNS85653.1 hypothetical protein SAMN06893096_10980 [Geodermatophilus pulveris]
MSVTDPDVPDPLNDPRTTQADPGAHGQGEDLASTQDDPSATGEDELTAGRDAADDAGGGDVAGTAIVEDEGFGPPVAGGAFSEAPNT